MLSSISSSLVGGEISFIHLILTNSSLLSLKMMGVWDILSVSNINAHWGEEEGGQEHTDTHTHIHTHTPTHPPGHRACAMEF